jgi:tetratricopeptide (TPR) repeat protein
MGGQNSRLTFHGLLLAVLFLLGGGQVQAQNARADYEQAVTQIKQGHWESAIEPLQRVLKQTPDNVQVLNLLGVALSASGRRDEANEHFRKVLAANPSFHPALKNMAVNEMLMGQTQDAGTHFKELLKYAPDDPVAHLALADIAYVAKDYSAAVEHFERSRPLHEADPRARVKFARSYREAGQAERALALLEEFPAEADAATRFDAGLLLAESGHFADAVRQFEKAKADGYPDAYQLGFNLTLAYLEAKQYPQAVQTGEALIAQGQTKAELYNLLARSYEAAGDTKKAYDALRTATQLDPADPANYVDLIDLCLDHNNIDLGLEIADIAVERLPQSQRLQLQRGVVLATKGRFDDSKTSFERAIALDPDNGLLHVALALIHMQMDRVPDAVEVLRARKKVTLNDPLVHWFLGEALNRQGNRPGSSEEEEAIQALETAVDLQPDLQQAQVLLGKMLLRRGDLERAATHLEIALKIDPDNLAAVYQLAQVRQKQGDREAAKTLFGRVQEAKTEAREEFTRSGLLRIVREGAK